MMLSQKIFIKAGAITVVLLLFFLAIQGISIFGQTATPSPTPTPSDGAYEEKQDDLSNQIKEYQAKIDELQSEAKTLSSQISLVDNQISLSELRIRNTQNQIAKLEQDIEIAKKKIGQLEGNISVSTKALISRVRAVYQVGRIDPWQVLVTSDDVDNFMTRLQYLKMVQISDKKSIYAAEQARLTYEEEKQSFEDKQIEAESLKQKLEEFNSQLEADKQRKQDILAVTKNSEKEYQRRLADAMRELAQIQKAAQLLVSTEPKDVKRGDAIGLMGNTGYSFGAHLHFGVYNITDLAQYNYYSGYTDPAGVLESQSVEWTTGCSNDPQGSSQTGSGSFAWPMSTSNLRITQGYGITCYSSLYYQGRAHPAYDMVNNSNIVVKAVDDGRAYICRNCTGDGANGVFLFHSNGKMTLYWHLQ